MSKCKYMTCRVRALIRTATTMAFILMERSQRLKWGAALDCVSHSSFPPKEAPPLNGTRPKKTTKRPRPQPRPSAGNLQEETGSGVNQNNRKSLLYMSAYVQRANQNAPITWPMWRVYWPTKRCRSWAKGPRTSEKIKLWYSFILLKNIN